MSTIDLDGAPLSYDVRGDGPPVVLVHAGVADRRMWDQQVDDLAEDFTVVAYDLRGFGSSPNPPGDYAHHEQLLALMDHLELDIAALVGCSLGAYVALSAAVAAPARVSRLGLLSPVVDTVEPDETVRRFWETEAAALERGDLDEAARLNVDTWLVGRSRDAGEVDDDLRELVFEMQRAAFATDDEGDERELEPGPGEQLETITQPVLIVLGEHDVPWVESCAHHLVEQLTDAQLEIVDDAAHLPSLEQPERVTALLRRFLSA